MFSKLSGHCRNLLELVRIPPAGLDKVGRDQRHCWSLRPSSAQRAACACRSTEADLIRASFLLMGPHQQPSGDLSSRSPLSGCPNRSFRCSPRPTQASNRLPSEPLIIWAATTAGAARLSQPAGRPSQTRGKDLGVQQGRRPALGSLGALRYDERILLHNVREDNVTATSPVVQAPARPCVAHRGSVCTT